MGEFMNSVVLCKDAKDYIEIRLLLNFGFLVL